MWSLGLPVLQFAEAANVVSYSNTLSNSAPSELSDHTVVFTPPSGVGNTATITLDFSDGPFVVGSVDHTDIDIATTSDYTVDGTCTGSNQVSAAFVGTTLELVFCSGVAGASIPSNGTTTIEIGENATFDVAGNAQLQNPGVGSYQIPLVAGASDTGETRVAIVENVTVTATVDTIFTFTVNAVASGTPVGVDTTGGPTTPTDIAFGELQADTASTAAQNLEVSTNAANGFVVTVTADQQLTSANGADIDGYRDGNFDTSTSTWSSPGATPGLENEAGHWGLSSDDTTITGSLTDFYNGGAGFVSASTTPVEVFRHDGPADGSVAGEGTANVIYKVEVTSLQEAADDYTATLTYVATPVF